MFKYYFRLKKFLYMDIYFSVINSLLKGYFFFTRFKIIQLNGLIG